MESLFHNLGLDWKLLLSQAINFFILLAVLRFVIYKPLLELLAKRRQRIEEGLTKAEEADRRLGEIATVQKEKMMEADEKALSILRSAEERGKFEEKKILAEAAEKEKQLMKTAEAKAAAERASSLQQVQAEAVHLIKNILIKTVSVAPETVDEALIKKVAEAEQAR